MQTMGESDFDVIAPRFHQLKNGRWNIVGGDFEATKFQLGHMWVLKRNILLCRKRNVRKSQTQRALKCK